MKRRVILVELDLPDQFSSQTLEAFLRAQLNDETIAVWGPVDGVDGAYRKLRQLSAETERDAPLEDRVHSAHKAMSFFRDMWPPAFWEWKRIGGPHPTAEEKAMAGR